MERNTGSTWDHFIKTTCQLLALVVWQPTGQIRIIRAGQIPKGSLYCGLPVGHEGGRNGAK